jgi:endogenous inhibitor of DNA gyrase (YacG/DUF329 family)
LVSATDPVSAVTRHCPGCGKPFQPQEQSPYRPFCSERCQLIDLGDWLTENHRIKGEELPMGATDEDDAT